MQPMKSICLYRLRPLPRTLPMPPPHKFYLLERSSYRKHMTSGSSVLLTLRVYGSATFCFCNLTSSQPDCLRDFLPAFLVRYSPSSPGFHRSNSHEYVEPSVSSSGLSPRLTTGIRSLLWDWVGRSPPHGSARGALTIELLGRPGFPCIRIVSCRHLENQVR
jgi:hypothetical protein